MRITTIKLKVKATKTVRVIAVKIIAIKVVNKVQKSERALTLKYNYTVTIKQYI